jgi:glycosyltransferase involved in cell wall biosynthesis
MKILVITSLLGKEYGGAEVSTNLVIDELLKSGCEVQALTTRKVQDNKRLVSISFPFEIPKKLLTVGNGQVDYFLARKIKKQIKLIKPDVIHVQDTYILPAAVSANRDLKVPSVATIHNSVLDSSWDTMFPPPISTMLKRRNKTIIKALHEIDQIITVSKYIKTELVERGLNPQKITPIYNLPPTFENNEIQVTKNSDSAVHLFALGLLASFKGFSVLVDAMKIVAENYPNVLLTIAGDGPQKKYLEKKVAKLKLESYVKFTGRISFAEIARHYAGCDIVIFPSTYPEPFGRVGLEAMYFGKPVVASRVGGIPEVVNEETGLLVPPGNAEELAASILTLVKDPILGETLGKKGKEIMLAKFDAKKIINQHLEVFGQSQEDKKIQKASVLSSKTSN